MQVPATSGSDLQSPEVHENQGLPVLFMCFPCIVLATGIYMVLGNCFGTISAIQVNMQAIIITALLVASIFCYKHFANKKLSPILLIVISAVAGMVVYGI